MQIEILSNPNCPPCDQTVFSELGPVRPIRAIRADVGGRDARCEITGVEPGPRWVKAHAVKIADSGEGTAFLITGGSWGIRLKPEAHAAGGWDLSDRAQWGEPYKIYGSVDDIFFE